MRFEIIEAKAHHCGQMARRMRPAQRQALIDLGIDPHQELRGAFDRSGWRAAWTLDGRLAGIAGIAGPMMGSVGHLWIAVTEEAERLPVSVIRACRRQLTEIMATRSEIVTLVTAGDPVAYRFALYMGFAPFRAVEPTPGRVAMRYRPGAVPAPGRVAMRYRPGAVPAPFVVFGLPRSRTTWLAEFLNYGDWLCHHDLPVHVDSLAHMREILATPYSGTVETAMSRAAPMLVDWFPEVRMVVVRRPVAEVEASAAAVDWHFSPGYLAGEASRLDQLSAVPGVLTVSFEDLDTEDGCRRVFEHCLHRPFDRRWWWSFRGRNIQLDMPLRLRMLEERRHELERVFTEIHSYVTIQVEGWATFWRDGQALFAEHYAEAGTFFGLPIDIDVEGLAARERVGRLLIVTARNVLGMVGYIVFLIDGTIENRHAVIAFQNIFFVRKEHRWKRLGPRIHARALKEMRARGVLGTVCRAGVAASGPKQKALFEREGARYMGALYYLPTGS